jgi:hypothetical protein
MLINTGVFILITYQWSDLDHIIPGKISGFESDKKARKSFFLNENNLAHLSMLKCKDK